ncbi:MAG: hypothetical protein IT292_01350 [Deltaproteobacteria bacterium]|nr:hypothetical protein [Deltaproteobacteria bacterium]
MEEWPNFECIVFRSAISAARKGESQRTYGTILARGATEVSKEKKLVQIYHRKVDSVSFPDASPTEQQAIRAAIKAITPQKGAVSVSLDLIIAQLDASQLNIHKANFDLTPPQIIVSQKPAVFLIYNGKPLLKSVAANNNLMFAINTNRAVFFDTQSSRYYLLADKTGRLLTV